MIEDRKRPFPAFPNLAVLTRDLDRYPRSFESGSGSNGLVLWYHERRRSRGGNAGSAGRSHKSAQRTIVGAITIATSWCLVSFDADLLEKFEVVEQHPLLGKSAVIVVAEDVVDDVAHGFPRRPDTSDWAVGQLVLEDP